MKGIIYLGLPYTHKDPSIEDFRADVSDIIAADLFVQGYIVFAPISSWHHIARKHDLPGDYHSWEELNRVFMHKCEKLLIITLPGWEDSVGVNAEMKLANKYVIQIEKIDPTPYIKKLSKGK